MNKIEFANKIGEMKELSKKEALEVVEAVFETLKETLSNGEEVSIHGFGKFEVKERAERMGVNPQTKQKILIPMSKVVRFKPAKALKEFVK